MLRLCGRPRAQALRGAGVKLLLDENLSDRIISRVADVFPDSTHIKAVGLREADDFAVWEWAKKHGFAIVSKDTDFHQRAIVFGHPPKIIWLRVGNCEQAADVIGPRSFSCALIGRLRGDRQSTAGFVTEYVGRRVTIP